MADTDGGWYSGSHIANDESEYLYTIADATSCGSTTARGANTPGS